MHLAYDHCCGATKLAINRKYEQAYNEHSAWQSYHEDDCSLMGACQDDSGVTEALCSGNVCLKHYGCTSAGDCDECLYLWCNWTADACADECLQDVACYGPGNPAAPTCAAS